MLPLLISCDMNEHIRFDELVWLQPVWQKLASQLQASSLHHALLFTGIAGLGKEKLALRIAKGLLCQQPEENANPCAKCKSCQLFEAGSHPDFIGISPNDKDQIPIDIVRDANRRAFESSHQGGARVILLHKAHCMNPNAANAFLKTLEEPPANVYLLLTSDLPQLLLATIISRCQVITIPQPSDPEVKTWLEQHGVGISRAFLSANQSGPLDLLKSLADGRQDVFMNLVKIFIASLVNGEVEDQLVKMIEQEPQQTLSWCNYMLMRMYRHPEKLQTPLLKDKLTALTQAQRANQLHRTSRELMSLRQCLMKPGINRGLQIQSSLNRVVNDVTTNGNEHHY